MTHTYTAVGKVKGINCVGVPKDGLQKMHKEGPAGGFVGKGRESQRGL